jgi:hypothetical protein
MPTIVTNPDGSITWTGNVTFTGATDPLSTGVATLTLTPSGGVSSLPALVTGDSGPSPTLRNINVTTLDPTTVPTPTQAGSFTLVTPGSAGVAAVYDLNLSLLKGAQGDAGTNATISAASDLVGTLTNGYTLVYDTSTSKWTVAAPKRIIGPYTVPGASWNAPYSGTAARYALAAITIPAQPWDWRPDVFGRFYAVGSTTGVHIDAEVRVGDPATGDLVGYGLGSTGIVTTPIVVGPSFGSAVPSSTTGKVAAGSSATITLSAVRTSASVDAWSTLADHADFGVKVIPL